MISRHESANASRAATIATLLLTFLVLAAITPMRSGEGVHTSLAEGRKVAAAILI
mgnify:CR=1 FL=1